MFASSGSSNAAKRQSDLNSWMNSLVALILAEVVVDTKTKALLMLREFLIYKANKVPLAAELPTPDKGVKGASSPPNSPPASNMASLSIVEFDAMKADLAAADSRNRTAAAASTAQIEQLQAEIEAARMQAETETTRLSAEIQSLHTNLERSETKCSEMEIASKADQERGNKLALSFLRHLNMQYISF